MHVLVTADFKCVDHVDFFFFSQLPSGFCRTIYLRHTMLPAPPPAYEVAQAAVPVA